MLRKTVWYACLCLLCCGALALAVNATSVDKPQVYRKLVTNSAETGTDGALMVRAADAFYTTTREAEMAQSPEGAAALEAYNRWLNNGTASAEEKALMERYVFAPADGGSIGNPLDATGGPDGFGYRYVDNTGGDTATFAWIELCSDTAAGNGPVGDDAAAPTSAFGFNFPFYGGSFNTAFVSTNGLIQFGTSNSSFGNACVATNNPPAGSPQIMPYWDDLYASSVGGCTNSGVAPWIRYKALANPQRFVIEWSQISHFAGTADRYSFQAILYPDGKIKLQYNNGWNDSATPNSATIGIDDAGAGNGLEYRCNATGNTQITGGRAIWFYPGPQVPGRCCYNNGNSCQDVTPTVCASLGGTYTGGMTCASNPCPQLPANDNCSAVTPVQCPVNANGDNTLATHDCNLLTAGQGETWHAFTTTQTSNVHVIVCPTAGNWGNFYIVVAQGCPCGGLVFNTNYTFPYNNCSTSPGIDVFFLDLPAGTYYYPVLRDDALGSAGAYSVSITCTVPQPCVITQQPGDIMEVAENFADTTFYRTDPDGGCNNDPTPLFQDIQCGQTIFGRTQTYTGPGGSQYRDTDWYRFTLSTTTQVSWRTTSEVPGFGFILDITGCVAQVIAQGTNSIPCDTAVATATLTPGTYAVWYGPQSFSGVPLSEYRGTLLGDCACDEAEQLTVIRAPYPSNNVNVRWLATQTTGRYQVYRTENKNNDGNPDGGTDPDWTLIATVPAPAAAPAYQQVTNNPVNSYYNYVVVHDCTPLGRCCYGNPQSPSCATNTETQCNALAGTWSIGLNCTDNPCPIPPVNDTCGPNNPLVTQGVPVNGTNALSTTDGLWPCAAGGSDVWYRYTATGTGTVTVSFCGGGTDYDSAVMVLASCGGTNLACNDDFCGLQSQTTFAATAGVTYWIAVGGFASNTGNFSMLVTQ